MLSCCLFVCLVGWLKQLRPDPLCSAPLMLPPHFGPVPPLSLQPLAPSLLVPSKSLIFFFFPLIFSCVLTATERLEVMRFPLVSLGSDCGITLKLG